MGIGTAIFAILYFIAKKCCGEKLGLVDKKSAVEEQDKVEGVRLCPQPSTPSVTEEGGDRDDYFKKV